MNAGPKRRRCRAGTNAVAKTVPNTPSLDVEAVRAIARDEVLRILARAVDDRPTHYSSRRGCGPAGVPEEKWREIAATIGRKPYPGARWYVVDRSVYEAWLAREAVAPAPANDGTTWDPSDVVRDLGLGGAR